MKTVRVNDYDMTYLELGTGAPLLCIHGSLNDFRVWAPVLKPFSLNHRLLAPSLRHYFPENWDGQGGSFRMAQHVDDVIAMIERLELGKVNLLGHSRGGHLAFRLALRRPDLVDRLILAEPGGTLDESLMTDAARKVAEGAGSRAFVAAAAERIAAGDIEGGLRAFIDGINGDGAWDRLPEQDRVVREDNAFTLLAQVNEGRQPYTRAEAQALRPPTLFIQGADTPGLLPLVLQALAAHVPNARKVVIPNAGHSMFRMQPKACARAVLDFLAG